MTSRTRLRARPRARVLRASLVATFVSALCAGMLAVVTSPAQAVSPRNDFPRMPAACATAKQKIPQTPTRCALNRFSEDRPSVVLWGDSHAWMMIPALREAARGRDVNLIAVVMGSCPPMDANLRPQEQAPACLKSNDEAIRLVEYLQRGGQGVRVILNGSWQRYVHAMKVGDRKSYVGQMAQRMRKDTPRLMRRLARMGVGTDVLGQVATVPARKARCGAGTLPYACNVPRAKALREYTKTRQWLVRTIRPLPGSAAPINVNGVICTPKVCRGRIGGVYTWYDDLHLSASRSRTLAGFLAPSVDRVAPRATAPSGGTSGGSAGNGNGQPGGCPLLLLC